MKKDSSVINQALKIIEAQSKEIEVFGDIYQRDMVAVSTDDD